jgi:hypothetical protein
MEKVVALVRAEDPDDQWCERIRGPVAVELLDLGVHGLTVNVRDSAVRHSMMTLTTLSPPVSAVISTWTQQSYGKQVTAALDTLNAVGRPYDMRAADPSPSVISPWSASAVRLRARRVGRGSGTVGDSVSSTRTAVHSSPSRCCGARSW